MKKMLVIRACVQCFYLDDDGLGKLSGICSQGQKLLVVDDKFKLPKWCPLPDYDAGQEKRGAK